MLQPTPVPVPTPSVSSGYGSQDHPLVSMPSTPQSSGDEDLAAEERVLTTSTQSLTERTPLLGSAKHKDTGELPVPEIPLPEHEESRRERFLRFMKKERTKEILNYVKIGFFFLVVVVCSGIFTAFPELVFNWKQWSVSLIERVHTNVSTTDQHLPVLKMYIRGSFLYQQPESSTRNVYIQVTNPATNESKLWKRVWSPQEDDTRVEETIETVNFDFEGSPVSDFLVVAVWSNTLQSVPVSASFQMLSSQVRNEAIYAAIILFGVYTLIIFELVHRTLAAMIGALAALSVLAALNEKPSLETVLTWLDYETLSLLFGMMVMVAIFCETGFFDWVALIAYKLARGKTWPLITILCTMSAVISAFLDNVTTILLLTPVTIRLCEVLELESKHILMAEVLFSNIGGTATAIGDPPNVLILGNRDLLNAGIDFSTFTEHMLLGSVFAALAAYILIRLIYNRKELLRSADPWEIAELKAEINIWRRQSMTIAVTTREENVVKALLLQKVATLENMLQQKLFEHRTTVASEFKIQVDELEKKYYIRDRPLLIKSGVVLVTVIIAFFANSFISEIYLTPGWIPILGAIWLLVLADFSDLDSIFHRIEWATLLFFAALFVLMKAVEKLELIQVIADGVTSLVESLDESVRLAVAIIIIVWVSAIVSSFIDNIPFTTAMIPVIVQLSGDPKASLPLEPLVWALAFGACLGGNGTLIGASANVVCAGIAETHGHGFTFWEFFKVGFPTMLVTVFVAMIYLIICHVAIGWHPTP